MYVGWCDDGDDTSGCIPPLVKLLETQDAQVIKVCLDALENILRLGEAERTIDGDNRMATYVEEAEGVEIIQNLQYHQNEGAVECGCLGVWVIGWVFDGGRVACLRVV